jgi:Fe-Mn family superoxide dismutase
MSKPKIFALPPLPYDEGALEPTISAETMRLHHGKHHKAYVDKLNELVAGTDYAEMSLEEVVKKSGGKEKDKKIFNNAAQAWNHTFFWSCLTPKGGGPGTKLHDALHKDLGGHDKFKATFIKTGVEVFGTGWVWLIADKGKLSIVPTTDADTPMAHGKTCLLTVDVWEHAYYLDYQNRREEFLTQVVDNLLNWDFAAENFAAASKGK